MSSSGYQSGTTSSNQFEQINANISSNIYKIKQNVNQLIQQSKLIGTDKDTKLLRDRLMRTIEDTNKLGTSTNNYFKQLMVRQWGKSEALIIEKSKKTYKLEMDNYGRVSKEVTDKLRTTQMESNESSAIRQDTLISFENIDKSLHNTDISKLKNDENQQRIQQLESNMDIIIQDITDDQVNIVHNEATNMVITNSSERLIYPNRFKSKYRYSSKIFTIICISIIVTIISISVIVILVKVKKH